MAPYPIMILPFVVLLLLIAFAPVIHKEFWERSFHKITVGLALIPVVYYVFVLHNAPRMLASAVDYIGFMALIGSLFLTTSGIHIKISGRSTPAANTGLLALGALMANVIGTTGASLLLIRPFLRMNKYRAAPYQVVFFIFIISNIGGALTPIGDPPLFLGYLKGIPFFWLSTKPQVILAWVWSVGVLLAVFHILDTLNFRKHPIEEQTTAKDRIELSGAHNFLFLFVIIALVLVQKAEWLEGLEKWPPFDALGSALGWTARKVTESVVTLVTSALIIASACLAHRLANKHALRENQFTFAPVREVGFLFLGIFATMPPALDWLEAHAGALGITSPGQFFWFTGALSSVLDNAPTYLNFLAAAFGLNHLSLDNPSHVKSFLENPGMEAYLIAISLGSVFFGACTYIGNGPNFMVKSIAESAGAKCPSFLGYVIRYTMPILLVLFLSVSFLILR